MKKQTLIISPTIKHIIIGVLLGAVTSFLCLIVCSFLLTVKDFAPTVATPLSNVCLAIGAFVAGFVCTMLHRAKGLVFGALSGLILFIIITLSALFVNSGDISVNTLVRLIFMVIISAAGGVIGVNKTAKHKMI